MKPLTEEEIKIWLDDHRVCFLGSCGNSVHQLMIRALYTIACERAEKERFEWRDERDGLGCKYWVCSREKHPDCECARDISDWLNAVLKRWGWPK